MLCSIPQVFLQRCFCCFPFLVHKQPRPELLLGTVDWLTVLNEPFPHVVDSTSCCTACWNHVVLSDAVDWVCVRSVIDWGVLLLSDRLLSALPPLPLVVLQLPASPVELVRAELRLRPARPPA